MAIVGLAMGMLIVCVGLVIDVGHAMLVQRQLQAGVDAAALAGVQHLPDKPMAESVAMQYSASPGSKNAVNTVDNAATTAIALCITGVPGCNRRDGGVNGIKVESRSDVPTWFGRIIGIEELSVSAKATACAPCVVKPLDIMLVLDRTGSMCVPVSCSGNNFSDLRYAKDGIETFLTYLDPSLDKVGLSLFPPVINDAARGACPSTPSQSVKYFAYDQWWHPNGDKKPPGLPTSPDSAVHVVASLEGADGDLTDDYLVEYPSGSGNWVLNRSPYVPSGTSTLLQRLGCAGGAGSTTYANSIEEAQDELDDNGRAGVQDVIIFLSDGGANTTQLDVPSGHHTVLGTQSTGNRNRPCGNGVRSAGFRKAAGTVVYTIGYDLASGTGTPEPCRRPNPGTGHQDNGQGTEQGCGLPPGGWGDPVLGCTSEAALIAMASRDAAGQPLYWRKPNAGQLNGIFQQIALDLSGSRGRLIDNTSPSLTS